jgi:hypothetical protein
MLLRVAALLTIPLKGMAILLKQATFINLQLCAQRRILVSYQSSVQRCSPAAKIKQNRKQILDFKKKLYCKLVYHISHALHVVKYSVLEIPRTVFTAVKVAPP